jgi:hypothetical protein
MEVYVMGKLESKFQKELIKELEEMFPGCLIMKQDENYRQGIPDLLILYKDKWAMLECKRSAKASHRPNQDYYIDICDKMSFAKFIYPENKEEVLDGLRKNFKTRRQTRRLKC